MSLQPLLNLCDNKFVLKASGKEPIMGGHGGREPGPLAQGAKSHVLGAPTKLTKLIKLIKLSKPQNR